jgi:hypothetical protein
VGEPVWVVPLHRVLNCHKCEQLSFKVLVYPWSPRRVKKVKGEDVRLASAAGPVVGLHVPGRFRRLGDEGGDQGLGS